MIHSTSPAGCYQMIVQLIDVLPRLYIHCLVDNSRRDWPIDQVRQKLYSGNWRVLIKARKKIKRTCKRFFRIRKFSHANYYFLVLFLTCRLFVNLVVIRCGLAWTGCIFIGCPDDQLDQLDQLVLVLRGICFREIVWNDVIAGRNLGRVDDDTAKMSNIQNCKIIISK